MELAFKVFDADDSGKLSIKEVMSVVKSLCSLSVYGFATSLCELL